MNNLIVAIDGPAGSGKSTIAKLLAKKYDLTVDLEAVPIAGVKSFAEVHIGRTLLYVNSLDKIGVAINQGSFSRAHQVESGYQWTVELKKIEK